MKSSVFLISLLCSQVWAANKYTAQAPDGHLEFLAIGRPAMIHIKGEGPGPEGHLEINNQNVTGTFQFPLDGLNTGINMRDRHMKEKYLEVAKNPKASMEIQNLVLKSDQAQDVPFQGTLELHGIRKAVSGTFNYETKEAGKKAHAEFKLRLSDFGITIPSYAGITVADEVQVKLDLSLKPDSL